MPGLLSLLDLPTEIRFRIYEDYSSSTIVRACAEAQPSSRASSSLSLSLVCKCVREESVPFLYKHALFWVDSIVALICMVNHHTSAQLLSIRHFAIRNSLLPLPFPRMTPPGAWETASASTIQRALYQAIYQQICPDLQTLVLFNTTNAGTRRRILEQQAGRSFTDDELERHCFDGMRLKAHLLIPVLKEHDIVIGPNRLNSGEDFIPFQIMLRYSGSDDKHRMGLYRPKKESQQPPVCVEPDDPGI